MIVYQFLYCSCIYESDWRTMSIHKTKLGAYKAMKNWLISEYLDWYNRRITYGKCYGDSFAPHKAWGIEKIKILD